MPPTPLPVKCSFVCSQAEGISPGDLVVGPTGWQRHALLTAREARVVASGLDPAHHLGVLGTNGLTAYFGLLAVGEPKAGDTVLVSAAAGSVGHIVGQLAKIRGCRVIGVAGSDAKCDLLVNELSFDAAVNRLAADFRERFKAATPDRMNRRRLSRLRLFEALRAGSRGFDRLDH